MNVPPVPPNLLEAAWRFARVLTGCSEGAGRTFDDALAELRRHPHADEEDRRAVLFLTILRRRALKFPARNELSGRLAELHAVPEPGRSALTLLCLNLLTRQDLGRTLHLEERPLAAALEQARATFSA
jgi:hypothetical protein